MEISPTRFKFAEKWREDEHRNRIKNFNCDIRDLNLENESCDICAIVDMTFTYFFPVDENLPAQVLRKSAEFFKKGGFIIIEMPTFNELKRLCESVDFYYEWDELPETNSFKYALYRTQLDKKNDVLYKESRYVYRHRLGDSIKLESCKVYSSENLESLVTANGFSDFRIYGGYDFQCYGGRKI